MDEETARVGAFLASESVPVLVSIPQPLTTWGAFVSLPILRVRDQSIVLNTRPHCSCNRIPT